MTIYFGESGEKVRQWEAYAAKKRGNGLEELLQYAQFFCIGVVFWSVMGLCAVAVGIGVAVTWLGWTAAIAIPLMVLEGQLSLDPRLLAVVIVVILISWFLDRRHIIRAAEKALGDREREMKIQKERLVEWHEDQVKDLREGHAFQMEAQRKLLGRQIRELGGSLPDWMRDDD